MTLICPLPSKKRDVLSAFGRCSSPAFDAELSSDYPGRGFSVAGAMKLRAATATDNSLSVDRTPAYDIVERREHEADVQARRAALHII